MSEMVGAINVVMVAKCDDCGEYVPEHTLVDGQCGECASSFLRKWVSIMSIERPVRLSPEEIENLPLREIDFD